MGKESSAILWSTVLLQIINGSRKCNKPSAAKNSSCFQRYLKYWVSCMLLSIYRIAFLSLKSYLWCYFNCTSTRPAGSGGNKTGSSVSLRVCHLEWPPSCPPYSVTPTPGRQRRRPADTHNADKEPVKLLIPFLKPHIPANTSPRTFNHSNKILCLLEIFF
ncbi:hypothetical protein XENTR_v10005086 [Xenopus tropicalis]|nr:hypothetical protein XENTR_v10005086 [Xenopus tropicalis]